MATAPTAFIYLRIMSAALLLLASQAPGQAAPTAPPQSVEDAIHQMSDQAGVIFAGQVVAVRRHDEEGAGSGFVEVEFRVDQSILGCTAGVPYLLHEWAGLWTGGPRYRVGQRLLMFLHAPGPSGLSSPIGGMDGAVPIHGSSSPFVATGASVATYPVADLRWIGTELLHPISYATEPAPLSRQSAFQTPFLGEPLAVRAIAAGASRADIPAPSLPTGSDVNPSSIPAQQAAVQAVVAALMSWQKAQHVVR